MQQSSNDSDSEEEILIYADFKELLDSETMKPGNLQIFKAIAMDSENPIVQLNNYFFQGDFQQCLGTKLFLEEDPNPPERDPVFEVFPETSLKFVCKTRKVMTMSRIFLNRKEEPDIKESEEGKIELESHASSTEEALAKFRTYLEVTEKDLLPYTKAPSDSELANKEPITGNTRMRTNQKRIDMDESSSD